MKNMLKKLAVAAGFGIAAIATAPALAASGPVNCGDATLGTRFVHVDPALIGGECYAQNGNFIGDSFAGTGIAALELIDKNNGAAGSHPGALGGYVGGATSGNWNFAEAFWDDYDRLFLAFHFGGAGSCDQVPTFARGLGVSQLFVNGPCTIDPDSFFVELSPRDDNGRWAFFTSPNVPGQNGLSNLYLVGVACTQPNGCNDRPDNPVPEPLTLALIGMGLAGIAIARRRRV